MKTNILFALFMLVVLCKTHASNSHPPISPIGIWEITITTDDESDLKGKIGITKKKNDSELEGYLKIMIMKTDLEDFNYNSETNNLQCKASLLFADLTFDLTFSQDSVQGTTIGSDDVTGVVKGMRKK